ncbi:hypothetical protein ABTQ33_07710 [Paucilactobacillus suebicus]|uniref:Uncharacterized protein n=1 Tax=Paucilactobacillus suebicus DSM 5007 = KCTC 3549 TaxID=1423807 RepID=A0A0R1W4C1_9LACO|nr:hypothetical protein FD16_GL001451 [Paucilactobacillus suebicus DSM 5007 = KCTC 3549]
MADNVAKSLNDSISNGYMKGVDPMTKDLSESRKKLGSLIAHETGKRSNRGIEQAVSKNLSNFNTWQSGKY